MKYTFSENIVGQKKLFPSPTVKNYYKNQDVVHIYNRMLAIKKEWNLVKFVITWMDWKGIMPGEMKSEKEIKTVWFHSFVESKNQKTEQKQTHR